MTAVELAQLREEVEGQSIGSSGSSSSDSFDLSNEDAGEGVAGVIGDEEEDVEIKEGKEVNQVEDQVPAIAPPTQIPSAEPILVLSSTFEGANDLEFPKVPPAAEDLIAHFFNQVSSLVSSSEEELDMVPKLRNLGKKKAVEASPAHPAPAQILALPSPLKLWAPKFATVKLGKQVTNADTSKDHDTYLAMGNVAILPQDVTDLAAEGSEEFSLQQAVANSDCMNKYSNDLKKVNQKAHAFKGELK
ncbi:hypothetical protein Acr_07g0014480 [Actinidia rufa]|uniref:Uncharacterized protein n=1 Tax=Actinidia rufa TaxID=165716 RepID=A0A7J0EXT5_9ERIC|nr:hypothetical protein Acr_07g0014480 [Actinidia rufa]